MKMNSHRINLFIFALLMISASCREEYYPSIDAGENALVVYGLLTNAHVPYAIKLNRAVPYNSNDVQPAVSGALVYVIEGDKQYLFHETVTGKYTSDTTKFIALSGHRYTLHIETPDGKIYESSSEVLPSPPRLDSIYGSLTDKEYLYRDVHGQLTTHLETGVETLINFTDTSATTHQLRFDPTLLIEYTYIQQKSTSFPLIVYMWKKVNPNNIVSLTGSDDNARTTSNFPVCFFPLEKYLYDIQSFQSIENWILGIKIYTLNDESLDYYQGIVEQTSATGKLFDPITSQLRGNIRCITHPDKLVLGLFETSSYNEITYHIRPGQANNNYFYQLTESIDGIPSSGKSVQERPDFWHVNK